MVHNNTLLPNDLGDYADVNGTTKRKRLPIASSVQSIKRLQSDSMTDFEGVATGGGKDSMPLLPMSTRKVYANIQD